VLAKDPVVADRAIALVFQLSVRRSGDPHTIALRALDTGASLVLIGVEQTDRAAVSLLDAECYCATLAGCPTWVG
jgi:hypothetical protein